MDSTAVYDSGNAGDSESWSSSEGEEQVIEISSHSRILISPRKARPSAWGEKSQRSSHRRTSASKKRSPQALLNIDGSPHSQSSRRSAQAKRIVKSYWSGSPRKTPSSNQPVTSNNRDKHQQSGSDESDGDIASDRKSDDFSSDSDGSLDDTETPAHRRAPRMKHPTGVNKTGKSAYKYTTTTSLNDSMQSHDSPATPGKEMEELKATLKKLARHDDNDDNPILQKAPNISSATALHEYLTAATALGGVNAVSALGQTRPTEYPGLLKTRHASFHPPRKNAFMATGPAKPRSKSFRECEDDIKLKHSSTADKLKGMQGNGIITGNDRLSFNKKLFSTPPPPFGGPGKYVPGLAFPAPANSKTSTGNSGTGGGAQGSRAILSALKALQDKIARLEEERETLKQDLLEAEVSARKREAELASSEKKFLYELGQTKESARAAYDALRCDREELKLQLVKSEERRKATQVELQHFQELTKTFSAKADDLQAQLQISESHRTRLKAEMKESESEHKRVINELQTELAQVRQDQQAAVERNELLEEQFQRESSNHAESKVRLKDSEQTVASISQLNEKLVAKVMEATEAANQAIKKNKKLQQQIRPSTLLRPTAASRASAAAASEAASRRAGNATAHQSNAPVRTLKKKKASTGTSSSAPSVKKPKKAKGVNNMTLLREANLGKEIPFLLGNSVQPSFSLIGNVQDALRRCDTTYMMPRLLSEAPITPGSTLSHHQPMRTTHSSTHADAEATSPEEENAEQMPHSASPPSPGEATMATPVSATPKAGTGGHRRTRTKPKPPAIKVPTASPKTYASPMQSQIMEDLGAAVEAAEQEFKVLNKRYKDLVAQMEANNRRASSGTGHTKGNNSSAQLSQALGPLLDDLEAKAKQLNLLKQVYQQASNSTINPPRHVVLSPEAIRRKTASLRLLNEFRQLESDSKNKGSGRSASPSTHLGANGFFH